MLFSFSFIISLLSFSCHTYKCLLLLVQFMPTTAPNWSPNPPTLSKHTSPCPKCSAWTLPPLFFFFFFFSSSLQFHMYPPSVAQGTISFVLQAGFCATLLHESFCIACLYIICTCPPHSPLPNPIVRMWQWQSWWNPSLKITLKIKPEWS